MELNGGKVPKKKRRKTHRKKKLDEDDYDLIQDNIGVKLPRKKLTKNADKE